MRGVFMEIGIGVAMIVTGLIMNVFFIFVYLLSQRSWFLKENFKIQKSNIMAENRIKLKKLEREMGVSHTPVKEEPTGNILDLIKNLDIDKIQGILELLGVNEEEQTGSPIDTLVKMATENPEIVSKFIGGLKEKNTGKIGEYL